MGAERAPFGTRSSRPFWGLWAARAPRGRLISSRLCKVLMLCWSASKTSGVPAAFVVNSGTRVMACRECVKWFDQKQSTAVQRIDSGSFKSPRPELLSGCEGTNRQTWSCSFRHFRVLSAKAQNTRPTLFFFKLHFNLKAMLPLKAIPLHFLLRADFCPTLSKYIFNLLSVCSQPGASVAGRQRSDPVISPNM